MKPVSVQKEPHEKDDNPVGRCSICGERYFSLKTGVCPACLHVSHNDVRHSA